MDQETKDLLKRLTASVDRINSSLSSLSDIIFVAGFMIFMGLVFHACIK